jgi:hypothetical protein
MKIWRMPIACWIPKATDTLSEHVIRIAFPLQQLLHERSTMLRYTHIACIVLTLEGLTDLHARHCEVST